MNYSEIKPLPVALAALVVCVILFFAYKMGQLSDSRFYLVASKDGVVQKIDKHTGQTWGFKNGIEIKPRILVELPGNDLSLIHGRAGYDREFTSLALSAEPQPERFKSTFSGTLYNGSEWQVAKIEVRISNVPKLEEPGKPWDREFRTDVFIDAKANGTFSVDTIEGHRHKADSWQVVRAWGYETQN
ncbi:MAG: hypothetical protein ACO1TE_27435 [Prosthecobacter sp.]